MPIGIRNPEGFRPGQKLLSLRQLPEILGVTDKTAFAYVINGLLPAIEAGGRYFVRESDALAFRGQFPTPLPRIGRMLVELKSSEAR